nr:ABC transporter permease [Sphingomicrobium nitratireducens]
MRAALVIARRDYSATVLSKTFLFFLLGPLFPLALGFMFGNLGGKIVKEADQPRVAVVSSQADYDALVAARDRLAPLAEERPMVGLVHRLPEADAKTQREALLAAKDTPVLGVLEGGLDAPHFTGDVDEEGRTLKQLASFVDLARQSALAAPPGGAPLGFTATNESAGSLVSIRMLTARAGQFLLFFLTLLLAGMLLSQMLEEKSNKVIEVLASSVPVDAIFVGKLFAMLAISLTGIAVWFAAGIGAFAIYVDGGLAAAPPAPAVGWPLFLVLLLVYFSMSYLLVGAAFLGIGAQASTVREVQTMSMPVTMLQVVLLLGAQAGVGKPDSIEALAAAVFPFTSPFAMIARAAEQDAIWPHLVALGWQMLWVALILKLAAKLFRKSVLKSGKPFRWPWMRKTA